MVKVTDNLLVLAAEASAAQHLIVDAGAVDMLLYELRRKFARIVVDLPRAANPIQRVVLGAASHVVVVCERSLAGLRDTIRLQTLMRDQAPQVRLWLVEAGATGERALIGKSEFEKGIAKSLETQAFLTIRRPRGQRPIPASRYRWPCRRARSCGSSASSPRCLPARRRLSRNVNCLDCHGKPLETLGNRGLARRADCAAFLAPRGAGRGGSRSYPGV